MWNLSHLNFIFGTLSCIGNSPMIQEVLDSFLHGKRAYSLFLYLLVLNIMSSTSEVPNTWLAVAGQPPHLRLAISYTQVHLANVYVVTYLQKLMVVSQFAICEL